jgi:hypothetical protein
MVLDGIISESSPPEEVISELESKMKNSKWLFLISKMLIVFLMCSLRKNKTQWQP